MQKIAIIGMGQIGGSVGKALRAKRLKNKYYIIGIDKDKKTLKAALKTGAADEVSDKLLAAKGCETAIICLPADLIAPVCKRLLKIAGKETVITDAGSVKESIVKDIKGFFTKEKRVSFVPAHPMAGKEKNGIMSASADMFKGANLIITESSNPEAEKKVARIWKDAGAKIIKMSAKKHDSLAAMTSHLPHIIAFALNKIYKKIKAENPEIDALTAGSFKSMTRVSVSSADMWAPIFAMNNINVRRHLKAFIKELQIFEKSLNNQSKLKKEILKTQK
jgi:prephenate dehydrogenase